MKTLVFCTAFARAGSTWSFRYRRWVDAIRASSLQFDQILIVDDGSPVVPDWPDMTSVYERDAPEPVDLLTTDRLVFYHFDANLGRRATYDFPGWYRSFAFAASYAKAHGFEKVIHIESDAYLVSGRMHQHINALGSGWTVLWCPRVPFPEMAIQVIVGAQIENLAAFFQKPYAEYVGKSHEWMLPYTDIEKSFTGDRYGVYLEEIPSTADYANQVPAYREAEYYWWLDNAPISQQGEDPAEGAQGANENITIEFGEQENGRQYVGSGWSFADATSHWMTGDASEILLPELSPGKAYTLIMRFLPVVGGDLLPTQRLFIEVNGTPIAAFEIELASMLGIRIPASAISQGRSNLVRFAHPDATSPAALNGSGDRRLLAFLVQKIIVRETR